MWDSAGYRGNTHRRRQGHGSGHLVSRPAADELRCRLGLRGFNRWSLVACLLAGTIAFASVSRLVELEDREQTPVAGAMPPDDAPTAISAESMAPSASAEAGIVGPPGWR